MKLYLIILFITYSFNSFAQIDSLRLKKRIDSLMKLDAYSYSSKDYESFHEILNKAKRIGYHKGVLLSRIQLIWYYSNHNNIDSLFFQGKKIEEYLNHHYNKDLDLLFSKTYGQVLLEFYSSPEISIGYYLRTLDLINENDYETKAHVSTALSYAYTLKGDYDKAINEIENLLQSATVDSKDNLIAIDAKCALSIAYQFKGNASKSRVLLNEIKEVALKEKNKRLHSYIRLYEGRNYLIEGKYHKAIKTIESNFSNLQKHLPHGIRTHYEFLAKSYAGLKDYESAIKFLKKSLLE